MNGTKSQLSSTTIIFSIISILAGVAGAFGYAVTPDDQVQAAQLYQAAFAVVTGVATWYGRVKASKVIK